MKAKTAARMGIVPILFIVLLVIVRLALSGTSASAGWSLRGRNFDNEGNVDTVNWRNLQANATETEASGTASSYNGTSNDTEVWPSRTETWDTGAAYAEANDTEVWPSRTETWDTGAAYAEASTMDYLGTTSPYAEGVGSDD